MPEVKKVVIIEKSKDVRDYFRLVLKNEPDIEIVGTASDEESGVALIIEHRPDVVLLDIKLDWPRAGICIIQRILAEPDYMDTRFVVITDIEERSTLIEAYSAGASDFLSKDCSITDVITAIKGAGQMSVKLRPEIGRMLFDEIEALRNSQESLLMAVNYIVKLTHSEIAILKALVDGESYRSIAQKRFLSETTIRVQASNIVKKCGRKNVKDLVNWMRQLKFMSNIDL